MGRITVEGISINVDDSFFDLDREQQDRVVDEIASSPEFAARRQQQTPTETSGGFMQTAREALSGDRPLGDLVRAVPSGVLQTLTSTADLPAQIMGLLGQGVESGITAGMESLNMDVPASVGLISESLQAGPFQQNAARRGVELMGGEAALNYEPTTEAGQWGLTAGQTLPSLFTGPVGTMRQAGSSLLRYVLGPTAGMELASDVAQNFMPQLEPYARFVGALAGTSAGGAVDDVFAALGRAGGASSLARQAPTLSQLEIDANKLYEAARQQGASAPQPIVNNFVQGARNFLRDEGVITPAGRIAELPKIRSAIGILDDYRGQSMNPTEMLAVRQNLRDAARSLDANESRLGTILLQRFDDMTSQFAPQIREANQVYARQMRGEMIERAVETARANADRTQSSLDRALRTEFGKLDRSIVRGDLRVSDQEAELIRAIARGDDLRNILYRIGKFAPTGPVGAISGFGVPYLVGQTIGGPYAGLAASAIAGGATTGASRASQMMTENLAGLLGSTARAGGAPAALMPRAADATGRRFVPAVTGLLSQ